MAQVGIRMVSENFEKFFLTFLGLGTNVVKVSSVNSELLLQLDTLVCLASESVLKPYIDVCEGICANTHSFHTPTMHL